MSFAAKTRAASVVLALLLLLPTLALRDTEDASDRDHRGGGAAFGTHALSAADAAAQPPEHRRITRTAQGSPRLAKTEDGATERSPERAGRTVGLSADCDAQCDEDLARARAAAERYWDVGTARNDGFVELSVCRPSEAGSAGIGYTNLVRLSNTDVDVERPTTLLYVPEGLVGVGRRLVGVEYSVPANGQPPPELFGQTFSGPAPARNPVLPEHYYLRAWLFSPNPDGTFADVNPAEACDRDDVVEPHVANEDCHEVHSFFAVPEEHVRRYVPDRFTIRVDHQGDATVAIRTGSCERSVVDGTAEPAKFTIFDVTIEPPDWPGGPDVTLYVLQLATDNRHFAERASRNFGLGQHSDELVREFVPIVGMTGDYRFSSPDFVQTATVSQPVPAEASVSARFWHDGSRGTGLGQLWHKGAHVGSAVGGKVAPTSGSLVAEILGCVPTPDPHTCGSIEAVYGLVLTWERNAINAHLRDEWWNPRHAFEPDM